MVKSNGKDVKGKGGGLEYFNMELLELRNRDKLIIVVGFLCYGVEFR